MRVFAPTTGRQKLATFASVTFVLVALTLLAACSNEPWHVSREPKLRVDDAAGCPRSLSGYGDVVNTYSGSKLVPPGPTGGIICEYHPTGGSVAAEAGQLTRQTRLDPVEATHVAEAVRGLDLRPPTGKYDCPAAIGAVEIIGLSYNSGPDVGLWYSASGCKSLDNGRLGSFEVGNPSFYETFEEVINDPSSIPLPAARPTIVTTPPVTFTIPAGQTPNGLPPPSTTVG